MFLFIQIQEGMNDKLGQQSYVCYNVYAGNAGNSLVGLGDQLNPSYKILLNSISLIP